MNQSDDNGQKEKQAQLPSQRLSPETKERALRDVAWVAEFLGVSRSWVYQATSTGVLPCVRLGATLRFEKAAIERWLKGEKSKSVKLPGCR